MWERRGIAGSLPEVGPPILHTYNLEEAGAKARAGDATLALALALAEG